MNELAIQIGDPQGPASYTVQPPAGLGAFLGASFTIDKLVSFGINILLIIVVLGALFVIILSGVQWVTAGGDKHGVEAARNRLMYAIIGLAIALSAFFIVQIVGSVFNISFL